MGISAFGSFIAGTLGIIGLMIFATPLAEFALQFGPPEYFAVVLLGLDTYLLISQPVQPLKPLLWEFLVSFSVVSVLILFTGHLEIPLICLNWVTEFPWFPWPWGLLVFLRFSLILSRLLLLIF